MTKEELLVILERCRQNGDHEDAHGQADDALIAYINDAEIAHAFEIIEKWYA